MSLNITKLESILKTKGIEVEKARKDVDKVKEEWNKKIQRGDDKVATLEDRLKAKAAEFDTMKASQSFGEPLQRGLLSTVHNWNLPDRVSK